MRPLIVSCNISLDGFMAGPEGDLASLRFIVPDEDQEDDLADRFRSTVDTIVIGRQTFLDMEAHWTKVESPMADWINATPKVVLTSTADLDVSIWPGTTLATGDGAEQVRKLKESGGVLW
ncbi:dihydrofolate reductase family protein [Microlunatus parietis]|uniref:Dihydrofolate reductase n=1 Tax=Microlunatus parietis TaxID=682979 RepID=A0A7Y9LEY1_9ACTN|nr:dihydrofolate reductase family protein [Microlunatus parietis]NYE74293.1 dihydrofolate reductase [Microlunatus parietis]